MDRQAAGSRSTRDGIGIGITACFNHSACAGAADHRSVVFAVDRHAHHLGCAISRRHSEGVRQGATGHQGLHGTVGVVERIGPNPTSRHGVCTVASRAGCGRGYRSEGIGRAVHIGGGQSTRGSRCTRDGTGIGITACFDHSACAGAADGSDRQTVILQQTVQHAPGERPVRAAALQGKVKGFRAGLLGSWHGHSLWHGAALDYTPKRYPGGALRATSRCRGTGC